MVLVFLEKAIRPCAGGTYSKFSEESQLKNETTTGMQNEAETLESLGAELYDQHKTETADSSNTWLMAR